MLGALRQRDGSLRSWPLVWVRGCRRDDTSRGSGGGRLGFPHGHRRDVFAFVHLEVVVGVVAVVAVGGDWGGSGGGVGHSDRVGIGIVHVGVGCDGGGGVGVLRL